MADRTIPHAYPMSVNYEMCTPARIYDQNFAEGKGSVDGKTALMLLYKQLWECIWLRIYWLCTVLYVTNSFKDDPGIS